MATSRSSGTGTFDALHEIALLIAGETELDRVLERVLAATEALLGARSSSVFLHGADGGVARRFTTLHTGEPHWEDGPIRVRPGGITETVLRLGRCVSVEDLRELTNPSPHLVDLANQAILAAPLRCQNEVIGVLYANFPEPRGFDDAARGLLETLGAYAATAVRNAQRLEAERRAAQRLAGLLEMARAASSGGDLQPALRVICRQARPLLDCDTVVLHRLRTDGTILNVAVDGETGSAPRVLDPWEPDPFIRRVMAERRPLVSERPGENPTTPPVLRPVLAEVEVAIVAPLMAEEECLGLVTAFWRRAHQVDDAERQLIETIARQAAIAMKAHAAREAAIEAARLEGAVKTAQAAAHELSQPLAVVVGYAELVEGIKDPAEMRRMVGLIARAADIATVKLDRFRNVMRFVELRFGSLEPILDVERASAELPPAASA